MRMALMVGTYADNTRLSIAEHKKLCFSRRIGSRAAPSNRSRQSKHGPQHPRRELLLADAGELALRLFARGDGHHLLEYLPADVGDADAVQHHAAVDVHVVFHALVKPGV